MLLIATTAFATVKLHKAATQDAPVIANEIAAERYGSIQTRLDDRLAEARQLIGEFFVFLGDVLEENPTIEKLERQWETASANANLILSDLANLREAPVASSKNLWETGRDRIEAIVIAAARMILAIQEFVPNAVASLEEAQTRVTGETTFTSALDAVETLLVPVMEAEMELVQRWSILRNRIQGWKALVDEDVAAVRESLRGKVLTDEFFERLSDAIW